MGYRWVTGDDGRKKAEHRFVVENTIGMELSSSDIVHHIDGDRDNNDPSNLQVMSRAEHINVHRQGLKTKRRETSNEQSMGESIEAPGISSEKDCWG